MSSALDAKFARFQENYELWLHGCREGHFVDPEGVAARAHSMMQFNQEVLDVMRSVPGARIDPAQSSSQRIFVTSGEDPTFQRVWESGDRRVDFSRMVLLMAYQFPGFRREWYDEMLDE
jgi:hypothetical protein